LRAVRRLSIVALAVALAAAPAASARPTATCKSLDMRYAFVPGGAKNFGVFQLLVTGGSCATARRVARAWMTKFEASIQSGSGTPPRSAAGFTFTTLRSSAAQTYRERGRRGTTSMRFDYRVPNG
jgi:hypothetical protein